MSERVFLIYHGVCMNHSRTDSTYLRIRAYDGREQIGFRDLGVSHILKRKELPLLVEIVQF